MRRFLLLIFFFLMLPIIALADGDDFPPGYDLIRCEGVNAVRRGTINFTDSGVTCADDAINNETEISGLGGGAGSGDVTAVGDCATGACFSGTSGTTLTFNNAGGDGILDYDGTDFNFDKPITTTGSLEIGSNASVADSSNRGMHIDTTAGAVSLGTAGGYGITIDLDGKPLFPPLAGTADCDLKLTLGGYPYCGTDANDGGGGSGDVTAAANMADNTLIRGDGGAKGIQDSGITVSDADAVSGLSSLSVAGDIDLTGNASVLITPSGGSAAGFHAEGTNTTAYFKIGANTIWQAEPAGGFILNQLASGAEECLKIDAQGRVTGTGAACVGNTVPWSSITEPTGSTVIESGSAHTTTFNTSLTEGNYFSIFQEADVSSGATFTVEQAGGNPTGGDLVQLYVADADMTALRVGQDDPAENMTIFSSTGAISQLGTATLTLQDGSDLIITANPAAAPFVATTGDTMTGDLDLDGTNINVTLQHTGGDEFGIHTEAGSLLYLANNTDSVQYLTFDNSHAITVGSASVPTISFDADAVILPGLTSCDTLDTNASGVLRCGTDADSGGSTAWDSIGDPSGNGAIAFAETVQTLDWDSADTAAAYDALTLTFTHDSSTDSSTQRGLVIERIDAGFSVFETLLQINNNNANGGVATGIEITSAAGTISTGIDVSDPEISDAIDIGANPIITGNVAGTIGDSTTDSWTFTTDGTGDSEIILPNDSIGPAEIDSTTGAYDFGGVTSFELPNSATPTTDATGEIALDTTITDHQPLFQYFDGGENMTVIAIDTAQLPALDNEIIAYDAATDKFVLEAPGAGSDTNSVKTFVWPMSATLPLEAADSIPPVTKDTGTNNDILAVSYNDSTDECRTVNFIVPTDVQSGSTITFGMIWYSQTATTGNVIWDFRHTGTGTEGEDWDQTLTTEASAADAVQGTVDLVTRTEWTETLANTGWAADDMISAAVCRDANNAGDTMTGDAEAITLYVEVPRS